ncbi:MAG: TldD/PmbA family protein [Thermoplasmata archaeon]
MAAGRADTAFRVAEELRRHAKEPWDVYGERTEVFEIHLLGSEVEMVRGPLRVEGFGVRLFRPANDHLGVGFAASSMLNPEGIQNAMEIAESTSRYSRFPVKTMKLPEAGNGPAPTVESDDPALQADPLKVLEGFVASLLDRFEGRKDVQPSFGSVKVALAQVTVTNSTGLERAFPRTTVEFEMAVTASGGPQGAAPGEYWLTRAWGGLPNGFPNEVDAWCRHAEAVRHASPPVSRSTTVVFPTHVLADVMPVILGYRLSGAARLRNMMPTTGTEVGSEPVNVWDDGLVPFGLASAPYDDEGTAQGRRQLIDHGRVATGVYDLLHGALFEERPMGNGRRTGVFFATPHHFPFPPQPHATNLVVEPGAGGTREELIEQVKEGLWIEQLGFAFPDPVSGAFGGEIRLAYRIHDGHLGEAVRGGTVGGILLGGSDQPSILRSVRAIGSKPELVGYLSSPPMVIDDVTVAGPGEPATSVVG